MSHQPGPPARRRLAALNRMVCAPAVSGSADAAASCLRPPSLLPPADRDDSTPPLSAAMIEEFTERGFISLPGIVPDEHRLRLMADVDRLHDGENRLPYIVCYEELGQLCSWPPVVNKVKQLMAAWGNSKTDCAMHHIHASRHDEGQPSVGWHQGAARTASHSTCDLVVVML